MAFDFKKEYKELYKPGKALAIVRVPAANFLAIRGQGDPNEPGGEYGQALSLLYPVAYALKMSYKTDHSMDGFYEYVVPPLEGFWWQEGVHGVDYMNKSSFHWISMIRLPEFVKESDLEWARQQVEKKKKLDCSRVEFLTVEEGLCVQIMHTGSYDEEPASVEKMHDYIREQGYELDFSDTRMHHEIYLSDPRKSSPDKQKTVIRHPIRRK